MTITHPQPRIDPSLILIREGFLSGNHYLDLYCSFDARANEYEVEAVALSGTDTDITERCTASELRSFNMIVNMDGAGHAEAESRALDVMFGDDLQRLEALGVGA